MVTVTEVYDKKGHKIGEVAKCDCKPVWLWRDVAAGLFVAAVAAMLIFV